MTNTTIPSGVTSSGVTVGGIDRLTVLSGGTANASYVTNGGTELLSGGTASAATIVGGNLIVYSGGTALATTLNSGVLAVSSGGFATSTSILGGEEDVYNGGNVSYETISAFAAQRVLSGGNADFDTINNSGYVYVRASGTASATTVLGGGFLVVSSGGSSINTTLSGSLEGAAKEHVFGGGVATGVVIGSAGLLQLDAAASATISGGQAGGEVLINGGSVDLAISGSVMPPVIISGFAVTDAIDLGNLIYASSDTVTAVGSSLTVSGGGISDTITVIGASSDILRLSAAPGGGTRITFAPPAAPSALALSSGSDSGIAGDQRTDVAAPVITGSGTVGDTVVLYDGSTAVGSAVVVSGGTWSVTPTALSLGGHTLTATQSSAIQGTSVASTPLTVTIDPVPDAPTALGLQAASDSGTTGDLATDINTPTIVGSGTVGDTVTLYEGATVLGSAIVTSAGTWAIATGTLAVGGHTLTATQTDAYSDVSAASTALPLTIYPVPVPPSTPVLSPASDSGTLGDDITNDQVPSLTGTGTAGDTVVIYDGTLDVGSGTVSPGGTWSVAVNMLALGGHTLTATQSDPGGDVSAASGALSLTIVAGPPAPTLTLDAASDSGTTGDNATDIATPVIDGTGIAGDTVTLYDGSTNLGTATVTSAGTWAITTGTLALGGHVLTATQTDSLSQVSVASPALNLTINAVPNVPTPALSPSSDSGILGDGTTDITTPLITGSGDVAGDIITLYDGTVEVGTGTVVPGGSWSVALSTLTLGSHPLTATQRDAGGDVSAPSSVLPLTIVPVQSTSIKLYDSFVTGNTYSGVAAYGSPSLVEYQSFSTTNLSVITSIEIGYDKNHSAGSGGPTTIQLYSSKDNPSDPGNPIPDALITTIGSIDASNLNANNVASNFVLPFNYTLATNTRYWIRYRNSDGSAGWSIYRNNGGPEVRTEYFYNGGTSSLTAPSFIFAFGLGVTALEPPPPVPSAPALSSGSDSGLLGDNVTDVTTPVITGTGVAGDTIVLYDFAGATTVLGSAVVTSAGTWMVTTSALSLGGHSLGAQQFDPGDSSNGSTASGPTGVSIVLVPVAPTALTLSPASDTGPTGDDTTDITVPVITGVGTAGDVVHLYEGTVDLGSGTVTPGGTWSIATSTLALGGHTLTAKQTDPFGDVSVASSALNITIDTAPAAPTALTLAPSSDSGTLLDNITNFTTPAITGSGTVGEIVTLYDGTVDVGAGTVAAGGTWSVTTATLAAGAHVFTATETDPAVGPSLASAPLTVTIVTSAPPPIALTLAGTSDSGTAGDDITNVTTPAITGSGTVGNVVTLYDGTVDVGTGTVTAGGTWSITTSLLAPGVQNFTATETDVAANVSVASGPLAVTIDTTAPAAPTALTLAAVSDSGTQGDDVTNVTTPAITGSGVVGDVVTLYDGTVDVGTGTVTAGGTWSITTGALTPGVQDFTATQTDYVGNVSAPSSTLAVTIDTTAPAAPTALTLAPLSDSGTAGDDVTNITTPAITGSGAVGDVVTLYDGTVDVGTGTVTAGGTWSITTGALTPGVQDFTATETDYVGNVSAPSSTLAVTIDTTAPAAPTALTLDPPSDSGTAGDDVTNVTTPAITGTGDTVGDIITLYDGTVEVGTGTVVAGGTWSVTTSRSPTACPNFTSLTATQTDYVAGNVSAPSAALPLAIDGRPGRAHAPSRRLPRRCDPGTRQRQRRAPATALPTSPRRHDHRHGGIPGDMVTLYDGTVDTAVGTAAVGLNAGGTWSVTTPALAAGPHSLHRHPDRRRGQRLRPLGGTATGHRHRNPAGSHGAGPGTRQRQRRGRRRHYQRHHAHHHRHRHPGRRHRHPLRRRYVGRHRGTVTAQRHLVGHHPAALASGPACRISPPPRPTVAGNVSAPSAALSLAIDTAIPPAPTALVLAPASDSGVAGDGITNVTTPTITGTGVAGDTVTLYDGSTLVGTATVGTDGTWSVTTPALAAGPHSLAATQTDVAGNVSARSAALPLAIDTAIPPAPTALVLAPASDSGVAGDGITNVTTPVIRGTGIVGNTVTLTDGTATIGTAIVGADGTWSVTTAALAAGPHSLTATQTDVAGNVSAPSAALSLAIDTAIPAPPTALALAPASDSGVLGDAITSVTTPAIIGAGVPGDTITLYDGQTAIGSAVVGADGAWSVTTTLATGVHAVTATDTSFAGNVSGLSEQWLLTIHPVSDAPTALTLAPASDSGIAGDGITNVTTPTITGTGAAGDTITLYDGQTAIGTTLVGAGGTWSLTTPILAAGTHSLTATQTDAGGNLSSASAVLPLVIDTAVPPTPTAPALAPASDSGAAGDGITNVTTPTMTGTGLAGDIVTLYDANTAIGTATVGADGTWSLTTPALTAGPHSLTASQADAAGNPSARSTAFALTIETGNLAAPSLAETTDATNPGRPLLNGTAPAGATVTLYDAGVAVGTALATANGSWQFGFAAALAAGTHALTATATDAAGNVSPLSATLTIAANADRSYAVVSPPNNAGNTTARTYDSAGQFTQIDTRNAAGQLLQSVSNTTAIIEIYDDVGTLIGTITQPSTSASSQPIFTTQGQVLSATTGSGPVGSQITLIAESNIISSQGNDTITGGIGADTIFASGPTTSVIGGSGSLLFAAGAGSSTVLGGSGSATVFGGTGGGYLQGGAAGHNILLASGGNTTLVGGGPGDTLVGGGGNAVLAVQTGGVAFGGSGVSTVFGAGGVMVGGSGSNLMVASPGSSEAMWAGSGTSTLFGGQGGHDTLAGGAGNATLVGGIGNTVFLGAGGHVTATGGTGNDTFYATGGGAMTIAEGAGTDEVLLGGGPTTVVGGTGRDLYDVVTAAAGGADVISGFKLGTDQIRLFGYDLTTVKQSVAGNNLTLTLTDSTRITLIGVSQLTNNSLL